MSKIDETQMGLSSHSVDELEVCIAVSLQMSEKLAEEKFNGWPYIYIGVNGKPFFDLKTEPPFMPSNKAQKIIDDYFAGFFSENPILLFGSPV